MIDERLTKLKKDRGRNLYKSSDLAAEFFLLIIYKMKFGESVVFFFIIELIILVRRNFIRCDPEAL